VHGEHGFLLVSGGRLFAAATRSHFRGSCRHSRMNQRQAYLKITERFDLLEIL
jgi:hypothetical protein